MRTFFSLLCVSVIAVATASAQEAKPAEASKPSPTHPRWRITKTVLREAARHVDPSSFAPSSVDVDINPAVNGAIAGGLLGMLAFSNDPDVTPGRAAKYITIGATTGGVVGAIIGDGKPGNNRSERRLRRR
jgi:hypothetical protein